MKLLSKLLLPVLTLNLIASAFANKAPEFVYELFTPKQAAIVAATTVGVLAAGAWATNEDINAEVARREKKHKNAVIHPLERAAITILPSAFFAGLIGAANVYGYDIR